MIWARVSHWPSTFLGLGAGALYALQGALGCSQSFTDWRVWLPAVILAIVGGAIKGPPKP